MTKYKYIAIFMRIICNPSCFRSTPVEVLHTVILGPYKYRTGTVMAKLSTEQKREVHAKLSCADYSGIEGRMSSNITRYSQSFVGRDFKVWAQMAPFILASYLTSEQLKLWLILSKVNHCLHMSSSVYSVNIDCIFPQVFKLCYCHCKGE